MKRKSPPRLTRSSPCRMHSRFHTRASITELALPLHTTLSSNKQIFDDLVLACFSQMKTSFWYNIIPLDTNDVSDMSSAMGQRWEYLVHLLINAGYLYLKKKDIEIRKNEWDNLRLSQQGGNQINITAYQPRNIKKTWYVCKGIPRFKGPKQQSKAAIMGNLAYQDIRILTRTDVILNSKLKDVFIMHHTQYCELTHDINLLLSNDLPENNVNSRELIVINTEIVNDNPPPSPPTPPPPPPIQTKYEMVKNENMKFDFDGNLRKIMNDDEDENETITLTAITPRN